MTTNVDRSEEHKSELLIGDEFFVAPSVGPLDVAQLDAVELRDARVCRVVNGEDLFVSVYDFAGAGRETVAGRDVLLEEQCHLHSRLVEVEAERLSAEYPHRHAEVRALSAADLQDTIRYVLFYDECPVG